MERHVQLKTRVVCGMLSIIRGLILSIYKLIWKSCRSIRITCSQSLISFLILKNLTIVIIIIIIIILLIKLVTNSIVFNPIIRKIIVNLSIKEITVNLDIRKIIVWQI